MKRQVERFARPEDPKDAEDPKDGERERERDRDRDAAAGRTRSSRRSAPPEPPEPPEDRAGSSSRGAPRDLAHDLRSPLGAIANWLAILEEDHGSRLDAAGRDLLRRLAASAERARALLEGSLEASTAGPNASPDVGQPTSPDRAGRTLAPGSGHDGSESSDGWPSPELPAILLVEDDPDEVSAALGAFRRQGLADRVAVARDGREALSRLRRAAGRGALPRVVFLDLYMPGLDGWGVLEALRSDARTRCVPVVVVSSAHRAEDIREAYHRGANSFLRKGQRPEGSGTGGGAAGSQRLGEPTGEGLVEAARYWLERNEGCP